MIYSILFIILIAAAALYWRYKYVPSEVARNLAAFTANGSADDLQRGYHSREVWRRVWPGLTLCVSAAAPLVFTNWDAAALGFFAVAILLAGIFARYFTPLLNVARAAGRPDITQWYASPASKSWPDATAWVRVRPRLLPETNNQPTANTEMKIIILRTWYGCLSASLLLGAAVLWIAW